MELHRSGPGWISSFLVPFVKKTFPSPLNWFDSLVETNWCNRCGSISAFYSYSLDLFIYAYTNTTFVLIIITLLLLKWDSVSSPNKKYFKILLNNLLRDIFAILDNILKDFPTLDPLYVFIYFRIILLISSKKWRILILIALNLEVNLGRMSILIILSIPVYEYISSLI